MNPKADSRASVWNCCAAIDYFQGPLSGPGLYFVVHLCGDTGYEHRWYKIYSWKNSVFTWSTPKCWLVEDQLLWNILGIFQGEDRLKERGLEWEWGGGRASKMDMLRTRPSQKGDDLCMASRDWPHSQLLSPVCPLLHCCSNSSYHLLNNSYVPETSLCDACTLPHKHLHQSSEVDAIVSTMV